MYSVFTYMVKSENKNHSVLKHFNTHSMEKHQVETHVYFTYSISVYVIRVQNAEVI